MKRTILILSILIIFLAIGGYVLNKYLISNNTSSSISDASSTWRDHLYLPTYFTKVNDDYFIVDCGHNRVIYSNNLSLPILEWNTLEEDMGGPHSLATDGNYIIIDDTGKHQLQVYKINDNGYKKTQTIKNVGIRPHRVIYDDITQAFYVISSNSQTISKVKWNDNQFDLLYTKKLTFLGDKYTRSISIVNGEMMFVAGDNKVVMANYLDDSYSIISAYPTTFDFSNMNDILVLPNAYLVTTTGKASFSKVNSLNELAFEQPDIRAEIGAIANVYFFSKVDGRIYLTQIGDNENSIFSFLVDENGRISDVKEMWKSGTTTDEDREIAFSQKR